MYLLTEWEGQTATTTTEGQIFSCPARPKLSQKAFYHMDSLNQLWVLRRWSLDKKVTRLHKKFI